MEKNKIIRIIKSLPEKIPYTLEKKNELEHESVHLVTLQGQTSESEKVHEKRDEMKLVSIDGKRECAITSNPIVLGSRKIYFTRDGFKGTMALNSDTLLDSDAYKPYKKESELNKKLTDCNECKVESYESVNRPESQTCDEHRGDYYDLKYEGNIKLQGSKSVLREMNKGSRLKSLLQKSGPSKTQALMYLGAGAGIGILAAQYMAGGG